MRFLVADDSIRQRDVLVRILRDMGHQVVYACNDGGEAIEKCDELLPDVVLLDVSMRKVNGDVAAAQIHAKHPEMNVIVVSSLGMGNVARVLIDHGFGFISKPYTVGQFTNHLKALLHEFEQNRLEERKDGTTSTG